ncbi:MULTISPECIES: aminoglycoside phosphotransferase family protein [unclassified Leifsonia]|uniref:aminoglycoside phosphotransferase family protein n=1 Tax=unclassified Leifsonia TaxID=2663824 RepID=UPI0006F521E1|nr:MULTISPECIES: aminoglycoside phosphotransferase family protein [unclassified Leifsonia]KQX05117.1 hypothetical protein ASC59_12940 [Leifsonia sp. Root1293]KRA08750.1 hypothetical protein ASD61_12940 [Leifsonia sp. Root60]
MPDAPDADIVVDPHLVERLVRSQRPDLVGALRLVANGWDNAVFRLGDDLAVRMPRRSTAAHLIEHEQEWLPSIAARVPVAVPVPLHAGSPAAEFPWPWSIVPWFAGRSAASVDPASRAGMARPLADFVHALAVPAPAGAPRNPYRGVPLADREEVVWERLAGRRVHRAAELAVLWDHLVQVEPWSGPPLWVHGDLHPGNIVVTDAAPDVAGESVDLVAVVDFGDLTAGDPATDLAVAWLAFDVGGRAAFRARMDELGPYDDATWQRARAWALVWATAVADSTDGDGPISAIGRHAASQVLLEE